MGLLIHGSTPHPRSACSRDYLRNFRYIAAGAELEELRQTVVSSSRIFCRHPMDGALKSHHLQQHVTGVLPVIKTLTEMVAIANAAPTSC